MKNNNSKADSTSTFKITFLIAIFGMILITATLTLHSTAFVFAQSNSTNSTISSQSDNQTTTGGGQVSFSNLPPDIRDEILKEAAERQARDSAPPEEIAVPGELQGK